MVTIHLIKKIKKIIDDNGLNLLRVPSNPFNLYLVYRNGCENDAKELRDICEKYGGYLSFEATPEETFRIGQLLGYDEAKVAEYVKKRIKANA